MTKRAVNLLVILFVMLYVPVLGRIYSKLVPNTSMNVNFKIVDSGNHVAHLNDNYYYTYGSAVFNQDKQQVLTQKSEDILISATDDLLYVYDKDEILKYSDDLSLLSKMDFDYDIQAFSIFDNYMVCIDTKNDIMVFDCDSYSLLDNLEIKEQNDMEIIRVDDTELNICKETSGPLSIFVFNENKSFSFRGKSGRYFWPAESCIGYISSSFNSSSTFYEKFDYSNKSYIETLDLPKYYQPIEMKEFGDDKLVYIGTSNKAHPLGEMSWQKYHISDCIEVINKENMSVEKRFDSKKYERILYADLDKAITFYKESYVVHNMDDWSVTEKMPADEIKKGGTYTFEQCGEYIFVFDGDSGELLNKIKI
ncbi:MAG: hypothetical protein E7510_07565 [Ruminococcus sp.]|nr:hypothetical protein [Ruminococcus sp.]